MNAVPKDISDASLATFEALAGSHQQLEEIFASFVGGERFIRIVGAMKLTKTLQAPSEVLLLNDVNLQNEVLRWIEERASVKTLLSRYRDFDANLSRSDLPHHFPARVITGLGAVSSGQNIFLFFPECLGLKGRRADDFFGVELVDVWVNVFQKAVFGALREFPEVANFVFLQRLFWFGRRGFRDNPRSAWLNRDNDSWLSAFLWNRMVRASALFLSGTRWSVDHDAMLRTFAEMARDIEQLGAKVLSLPSRDLQNACAESFMRNEVEWNSESGFILPQGLKEIYRRCVHIEEIPFFHPLAEMIFEGDFHA